MAKGGCLNRKNIKTEEDLEIQKGKNIGMDKNQGNYNRPFS